MARRIPWLAACFLVFVGCGDKDDSAILTDAGGASGGDATGGGGGGSGGDSAGGDSAGSGGSGTSLYWFTTCGDPVCSGYSGPWEGVPACDGQTEGAPCETEGATCDFESDCNAVFICAAEDPKDQPGGCPISRARHKTGIEYLDNTALSRSRDELMQLKLAHWRYNWDAPTRRSRLGFLIDDLPSSPAVSEDGEHVDVYGYTSLAVATAQVHEQEIAALRAELAALRAEVEAVKSAAADCAQQPRP